WVIAEEMIISEVLIKEKGHQFAQALAIPEESFAFSNKWITRFKKHNGLKKIVMYSEIAKTNNIPKVQDDTKELLLEKDSTKEIEDQQEPQREPQGRS
ncbi:10949_t:CDS:2, partial [Racocetra persica]